VDYGQLFERILQRPSAEDTMSQAQRLAQAISTYQTAQRTKPVIEAIQRYGQQYSTAQDDAGRQAANAMANAIRANYLQGGGSPADLPSQYWGSNPTQGFQTSEGFQAPITGYEGLGRKEAMEARRQALMDTLTKRVQEAELSGIDPLTGQKTWGRQYQEQSLANAAARSGGGGGYSSGAGSGTQTDRDRANYASALQGVLSSIGSLYQGLGSQAYADRYSTETGVLAPIQVIEEQINRQSGQLRASGVDPDKLIEDAYKAIYGMGKEAYWNQF